jgi:hypothetical protein
MRKLESLFKEFINAPIKIYSGATFKKGLYDLLDVYANTVAGDLVVIQGNHDIGDNSIQLKEYVNWHFVGSPTISSDSVNGTFIGIPHTNSNVRFIGKPSVVNTVDASKRIVNYVNYKETLIIHCAVEEAIIEMKIIDDDFGLSYSIAESTPTYIILKSTTGQSFLRNLSYSFSAVSTIGTSVTVPKIGIYPSYALIYYQSAEDSITFSVTSHYDINASIASV